MFLHHNLDPNRVSGRNRLGEILYLNSLVLVVGVMFEQTDCPREKGFNVLVPWE